MKRAIVVACLLLMGAGCVTPTANAPLPTRDEQPAPAPVEASVVLPLDYATVGYDNSFKWFGKFVNDRFYGYHAGDDFEIPDAYKGNDVDVPVFAIAEGKVVYASWVSGYGGVILIQHIIDGKTITAIYGHVNIDAAKVRVGDVVTKGEQIAVLGDDKSHETDGERRHLHFSMYEGTAIRLAGYVQTEAALGDYIDPHQFFVDHGVPELTK